MEGPVNGQIYATIDSLKSDLELMMTSPLPGNPDTNNHRTIQGHRYQSSNSPKHAIGKRTNSAHNDRRRVDADQRLHSDNKNKQQQHISRKCVDNDTNYYSSSQESNSSKRVAPMWSPNSDVTGNHKYETLSQHHTGSHRSTTQAEIERLDDLLQELTPRLNDSPSEYLRRRRQSFSNSSKSTTFEGRARQDTFIQGFSPTSPLGIQNDSDTDCNSSYQHHVSISTSLKEPVVERSMSNTNLDGVHNKPRYSNWHSEEKKKLQRARSLLDEKDKYLTEQLRRHQIRLGGRDNSTMSPLGYRPGSSQQMFGDAVSDLSSNYTNKDYVPASEWEEVRMFSDKYSSTQARRATSEMDYPLRDISVDRRNTSPCVDSVTRRRPFIRHYPDKEEMNYSRVRSNTDNIGNYRAFSPNINRYQNGSPAHQDTQQNYTDDIPQVQRRNTRGTVLSTRLIPNNEYHTETPIGTKQKDRILESLPISDNINTGGRLSPLQSNINSIKEMEKRCATSELLRRSRNSGFQIRVSKLTASQSPTDLSADSNTAYTSGSNRRGQLSSGKTEESHNSSHLYDGPIKRDNHSRDPEPDVTCLHQNRQSTNSIKPANAHTSNNSSIRKSSKIWYQPNMSRDEAIEYLKTKPPGGFIVRQSHTFNNSYGLAVKVPKNNPNDDDDRNIRHFLIESNSKGVRIRGCANEPYFGSLTALVHQHTLTKLALPCCIILPGTGLESDTEDQQATLDVANQTNSSKSSALFASRTFVALYLGSIDTDSLTGIAAIIKAVEVLLENRSQVQQTEVSIRVSPEGVTLTDVLRKLFFRRYYPLTSISYCGTDNTASWDLSETRTRGIVKARIFGFVARKTRTKENMCHMLCECSAQDSARSITHFIAGCIAIS